MRHRISSEARPITTQNEFGWEPSEEMNIVAVVLVPGRAGPLHVISVHRTMQGAERQAETARQRYETVIIEAAVLAD